MTSALALLHAVTCPGTAFSGEGDSSYDDDETRSNQNLFALSATWLLSGSFLLGGKQPCQQEPWQSLGDWKSRSPHCLTCLLIFHFDSLFPVIPVINNKRCWGTFYKCVCLIILISERSRVDKKSFYLLFTVAM